ncbi:MAG: hypothetical protein M1820_000648 [Bogoriella megaspora]|nr:MAG: hypothetical protein M1820_000648 [Bogoriella megaspora]
MVGFHRRGFEEYGARESRPYKVLPLIETVAFFVAIAALCVGAEYALQLRKAPQDGDKNYDHGHSRVFSNVWAIFYCGTAPVVTIILAIIDTPLYIRKTASPIWALVVATIMAAGWIPTAVMWFVCNYSPTLFTKYDSKLHHYPERCFQWTLQTENDEVKGVSSAITIAMVALGFAMIVIYLVYICFAAAAVHVWRYYSEESVPMIRKVSNQDSAVF